MYLGPKGTYSHQVALSLQPRLHTKVDLQPSSTIAKVFSDAAYPQLESAPSAFEQSFALLPYENSTFGPVNDSYEILSTEELKIVGECELPVSHCLLLTESAHKELREGIEGGVASVSEEVRLEDLSRIEIIYSHTQALGQCSKFIDKHIPKAKRVPVSSTGESASLIHRTNAEKNDGPAKLEACIASQVCARSDTYGLRIAKSEIQDRSDNATRFLLVEPRSCKTGFTNTLLKPANPGPVVTRAAIRIQTSVTGPIPTLIQSSSIDNCSVYIRKIDRRVPQFKHNDHKDAESSRKSLWECVYLLELEATYKEGEPDIRETDGNIERKRKTRVDEYDAEISKKNKLKENGGRIEKVLEEGTTTMLERALQQTTEAIKKAARPNEKVTCLGIWQKS